MVFNSAIKSTRYGCRMQLFLSVRERCFSSFMRNGHKLMERLLPFTSFSSGRVHLFINGDYFTKVRSNKIEAQNFLSKTNFKNSLQVPQYQTKAIYIYDF